MYFQPARGNLGECDSKGYKEQTEYHVKLVLLSLLYFTSVAFYFVISSMQESVGGILFISHVIVPVHHCHNNEDNTIPLPVINSVWLYCDNPRQSSPFLHQFCVLSVVTPSLIFTITGHLILLCHTNTFYLQTPLSTLGYFCYYLNIAATFPFMHTRTS